MGEDRRDLALQVALGETSTWHVGQLGAHCSGQLQYIGFWQSLRSLLQNLCLSVPFGWHKGGGGASASTRGGIASRETSPWSAYLWVSSCPDSGLW